MQEIKDFLKDESTLERVDSCFVISDPECVGVFLAIDVQKKWAAIVYFNDKDFEVLEDSEDIEKYYSRVNVSELEKIKCAQCGKVLNEE